MLGNILLLLIKWNSELNKTDLSEIYTHTYTHTRKNQIKQLAFEINVIDQHQLIQ